MRKLLCCQHTFSEGDTRPARMEESPLMMKIAQGKPTSTTDENVDVIKAALNQD